MKVDVKKRDHKKKPYYTVFASEGSKGLYLSADSMRELNHLFVVHGCRVFKRETVPMLELKEG